MSFHLQHKRLHEQGTKMQASREVELTGLELPAIPLYIALVDMGFKWRLATPSREKHDETLFT